MNSPQDSPNCKIKNFTHQKMKGVPVQKVNFVENFDEVIEFHKNIIHQIEIIQIGSKASLNVTNISQVCNEDSAHQLEPPQYNII